MSWRGGGHCLSVFRAPCQSPGFTERILGHDIEFSSSWLKHHAPGHEPPCAGSWRLCRFVAKFCGQARRSGKVNFEKPSLSMSKDSKTTNLWLLKVWEAGTTEGSVLERAKCSEARQEETKIYWCLYWWTKSYFEYNSISTWSFKASFFGKTMHI